MTIYASGYNKLHASDKKNCSKKLETMRMKSAMKCGNEIPVINLY